MTHPKITPAGEPLPQYDDEPRVDPATLLAWLRQHKPNNWAASASWGYGMIAEVLQALQAAGDATLVKNATYRAMVRDGRDIERLGAALHRVGAVGAILEHDGNFVSAAIDGLERAREHADSLAEGGMAAVADAVRLLDAVDTSDPERAHGEADSAVLAIVPQVVRDAYQRLEDRAHWWATA